jgi:hypothetical protein
MSQNVSVKGEMGGGCLGAVVSSKDILSIKLSHLTYMLLNMHFDIMLRFTYVKIIASV